MRQAEFSADGDARADIVVVGSGVVGAMIADQLSARGHSVLILEAGLRIERAQAVENWRNMPFANRLGSDFQGLYPQSPLAPAPLYFPENNYVHLTGPSGSGFKQGYLRTVGGTTWHWAASCWRHLPVDLRMQSAYGVGRDWPISYEELEPYYLQAENEMGVAGPNDPAQQSPVERSGPYPMDMVPWAYGDQRFADVVNPHGYRSVPIPQGRSTRPWRGRPTCCGNNNCQPICPVGAMYNGIHHVQAAEEKGAIVLPQAVVYKIDTDENNRVTAVHWYDQARKSHKATGRHFVLACNALETPRLLLMAANERNPAGIANSSDQVGRNIMDHSGFHCFFLASEPLWPGRGPAQSSCLVGPRDGALPFGLFGQQDDPEQHHPGRVGHAGRHGHGPGWQGAGRRDPPPRRAWRGPVDQPGAVAGPQQPPDPEQDADGSAGAALSGRQLRRGRLRAQGAEAAHAQLRHIGTLFQATEFRITTQLNANNHMMGSVIMGANPKDSVVNGDCRAHDHDNLWLPGGGAMPSASVVNSTLSMAALA